MKSIQLTDPSRQLAAIWHGRQSVLLLGSTHPAWRLTQLEAARIPDLPSHVWLASSGTSGSIKIIALSHAALEKSAERVNAHLRAGPSDVWINSLPCHHVGGLAIHVRASLVGSRVVNFPEWDPCHFVRQTEIVSATLTSLVPTQVHDLVVSRRRCPASLRAVVVGGGSLDDQLHARASELGWPILRSYGLTEGSSQVATEASVRSSASTLGWLPLLDHWEARIGENAQLELRGPSLLTGWVIFANDGTVRWEDPKRDGWFRTSDRAELQGRQLRVLGRADDLVKIRGELVDVGALETALRARVTGGRIAIYCQPDERNGTALRVVAEHASALDQALALRGEIFPPYARPEEFIVGPIDVTSLGKTVRHSVKFSQPPRGHSPRP